MGPSPKREWPSGLGLSSLHRMLHSWGEGDLINTIARRLPQTMPHNSCCAYHGDYPSMRHDFVEFQERLAIEMFEEGTAPCFISPQLTAVTAFWDAHKATALDEPIRCVATCIVKLLSASFRDSARFARLTAANRGEPRRTRFVADMENALILWTMLGSCGELRRTVFGNLCDEPSGIPTVCFYASE